MAAAEPLFGALQNFLLADSWEATRAVVAAEPDLLLGEDAQLLLSTLAERARAAGDEAAATLLDEHRVLLQSSREASVDTAFAGLATGRDQEHELEAILAELAEPPTSSADLARRVELCEIALTNVSREHDPELWALVQASRGTALMLSTIGNRAGNLETAIAALESAIDELERRDLTHETGRALNNLGLALEARVHGPPDENLERAIAAYERALEVFRVNDAPRERAEALNNLANALNRRQQGRRDGNRERAIELYEEALGLLGEERDHTWVQTQINLGVVLIERFRGERIANLDRGVDAFAAALGAVDPAMSPADWAHIQTNLGNALQRRANASGDSEDLERAIVAYEAALEVYADVGAQTNRGLALSNLGNALLARDVGDRAHNIERSIACYKTALELLDRERHPLDWAQAQNNLGKAFRARIVGDRAENVDRAIAAYEAAAATLNPRNAPVEYAQVMKNLGTSYRDRPSGERDENLGRALDAYREALDIRVQIYGPDHPRVASLLYSIAKAQRRAGELEAARTSVERALAIDEAAGDAVSARLGRRYRMLAEIGRQLGDLAGAEQALRRALSIDEELHGPEHPDVYNDLRQLAAVRRGLGEHGAAIDTLERAISIEELSPWGAPGGVRGALIELGDLLREGGELAAAERALRRALSIDEAIYGPTHPRVAELLMRLAAIFSESGQMDAAREAAQRVVDISDGPRGHARPDLAASAHQLTLDAERRARLQGAVRPPAAPEPHGGAPTGPARITFTERMDGYVTFGMPDPQSGWQEGRRSRQRLRLRLQIAIDDVEAFLAGPERPGTVAGTLGAPGLGDERPLTAGTYAIEFDGDNPHRRRITYELAAEGADGERWQLRGERVIEDDPNSDALADASNLRVWLSSESAAAAGIVTVRHLDFIEQLRSIRIEAPTPAARRAGLEGFGRAALGSVWEIHARDEQAAGDM